MALSAKNNYPGKFLYLLCILISPVFFGRASRRDTLEYHQQQRREQGRRLDRTEWPKTLVLDDIRFYFGQKAIWL